MTIKLSSKGGGLPSLSLLTKKGSTTRTVNGNIVASLSSGQALQDVLDITTPIAMGYITISPAGSVASTIDRIIITTDEGVLYDGDATSAANQSTWLLGSPIQSNNTSTISWQLSTQSFRAKSLKIELETTSATGTTNIYSDLELVK